MGFQVGLAIFRFKPTLGLLLPFFRLNKQDAKSMQISGKEKFQSNYGQRMLHEDDSSASGNVQSCLGGRDVVAVVATTCGLQSPTHPKNQGG